MFASIFGMSGAFFLAGAAISGLQSALAGGSFWEAVGSYITDNWSETLAITSVTYIATLSLRLACSPKCFKEGTLVETEEGLKPIEEIQVGDKVLAYDEETGVQAYKRVVQLFRNQTEEWYHIYANGEEIICTGGHPFYAAELNKFIPARELEVGAKLLLSSGVCTIIEAIQTERLITPETTYNFEVEDFHTYFVGECSVCVHNKGCGIDLYRGGNDMTLKKGEYVIKDGLVMPGKDGVSVNLHPAEAARFGAPHKIISIPDGLTVAQKGLNPAHYVIRPMYAMTLNQYQALLYQVKLIPYI